MLDDIANNSSDSQTVTLMTDILKRKVTDIGTLISGNGTNTGLVTISDNEEGWANLGKIATCTTLGMMMPGYGTTIAVVSACVGQLAQ
ncbi:MAG TPA: hypothetical protein VL854_13330 [Nitrososphaeraceae archaeon]|nr:hypothetical protein [Nitrososphaeraceae archaeon]